MSFPPGFDRKAAEEAKRVVMDAVKAIIPEGAPNDVLGALHVYESTWYTRLHEMGDEIRRLGGEGMLNR